MERCLWRDIRYLLMIYNMHHMWRHSLGAVLLSTKVVALALFFQKKEYPHIM